MGSTWKALPWVMRWSNPGEPLLPRFFASQIRVARIVWCWDGNNNLILVRVADILSTHTSLQYPLRCCINQSSNLLRGKSSTHVHDQPTTTESMFIPKAIGFKLVAIISGWWLTYPSWKIWVRQWEGWHPIYWKNNPNVPNHQPDIVPIPQRFPTLSQFHYIPSGLYVVARLGGFSSQHASKTWHRLGVYQPGPEKKM